MIGSGERFIDVAASHHSHISVAKCQDGRVSFISNIHFFIKTTRHLKKPSTKPRTFTGDTLTMPVDNTYL